MTQGSHNPSLSRYEMFRMCWRENAKIWNAHVSVRGPSDEPTCYRCLLLCFPLTNMRLSSSYMPLLRLQSRRSPAPYIRGQSSALSTMQSSLNKCSVEAEPLHRYTYKGYHPVHLGDQFKDDRYRIIHKLGHGGYSTVWVARDQRYAHLKSFLLNLCSVSQAATKRGAQNHRF